MFSEKIKKNIFTFLGIFTILIWSSNVYIFKKTLDIYGNVAGIGIMYTISGIFGLLCYFSHGGKIKKILNGDYSQTTPINKKTIMIYSLFISNNIFSSLAFGTSPSNEVLLQVIIICDTWTILTNILLVKILKYKMQNKTMFLLGVLIGTIGIIVSCVGFNFEKINFINFFQDYYYSYFFAISGSISLSLYTIYNKKYQNDTKDDHIFISSLISGILMLIISCVDDSFNNYGTIELNMISVGTILYESLIACTLSYYLWNLGFKNGDSKIISNFSILTPMLNISFTSAFYGIKLFINIICGAVFLIISAILCKLSVSDHEISSKSSSIDTNDTNNSKELRNIVSESSQNALNLSNPRKFYIDYHFKKENKSEITMNPLNVQLIDEEYLS